MITHLTQVVSTDAELCKTSRCIAIWHARHTGYPFLFANWTKGTSTMVSSWRYIYHDFRHQYYDSTLLPGLVHSAWQWFCSLKSIHTLRNGWSNYLHNLLTQHIYIFHNIHQRRVAYCFNSPSSPPPKRQPPSPPPPPPTATTTTITTITKQQLATTTSHTSRDTDWYTRVMCYTAHLPMNLMLLYP